MIAPLWTNRSAAGFQCFHDPCWDCPTHVSRMPPAWSAWRSELECSERKKMLSGNALSWRCLPCVLAREAREPAYPTHACYIFAGGREREREGTYYFIFQGRLESFPASRLSLPLGSIPLRLYPERPSWSWNMHVMGPESPERIKR